MLVLTVLLSGCQRGRETLTVTQRMVAESPTESFSVRQIVDAQEVVSWSWTEGSGQEAWSLDVGPVASEIDGREGLRVEGQLDSEVVMRVLLPESPGRIDAFELETRGINREKISLSWHRDGESDCAECELEAELVKRLPGGIAQFVFEVGPHPEWDGPLAELALGVSMPRSGRFFIRSFAGYEWQLDVNKVQLATQRPWRVDLEHEVRDTVVGAVGEVKTLAVEVSRGTVLRFGYGIPETVDRPLKFEIRLRRGDGDPKEVFAQVAEASGEWIDAEIDLSRHAGRQVELEFVIKADTGDDEAQPLVGFWSAPEILQVARETRPNVVLISIDTLRADHLSLYGYARETSPYLDAWAERHGAAVFENAIAQAPWTLPSHVSMFSGLDALSHGVNTAVATPQELDLVAELLRQAGYATVGITGGGFVHPQWGLDQGFDRYSYFGVAMGFENELEKNVKGALEWIDSQGDRLFFMFFHTYEVHNPFRPRQPFYSEFGSHPPGYSLRVDLVEPSATTGFLENREFALRIPGGDVVKPVPAEYESLAADLYDAGIGHMDQLLGRLLGRLEELELSHPTVVIVTSDHGEMLGEHGLTNHTCLYEENLRIPLLIALPGEAGNPKRHVRSQVASVDIVPTILEWAGIEVPEELDGTTLTPLLSGGTGQIRDVAWSYSPSSNYGVSARLSDGWKYQLRNHVWDSPQAPKEELYDLESDPHEAANLIGSSPRAQSLQALVEARLEGVEWGARLRLFNRSSGTWTGRLKGALVSQKNLKAATPLSGVFRWLDEGAAFELTPSREVEILVGEARGERIFLELDGCGAEDDDAFVGPLSLPAAGQKAGRGFSDLEWVELAGAPETAAALCGLEIHLLSGAGSAQGDQEIDPELAEQLQALGYVE